MVGKLTHTPNPWFPSSSPLWGVILKVIIILFFSFLKVPGIFAQEEIFERYDPNTEITLQGKVVEIWITPRRPVIIGVKKQEKVYQVVLAPKWFIIENHIEVDYQDEVIIKGSKFFAPDGSFLILAKTLENLRTKKKFFFRDEFLRPCWRRGPSAPARKGMPKGRIP